MDFFPEGGEKSAYFAENNPSAFPPQSNIGKTVRQRGVVEASPACLSVIRLDQTMRGEPESRQQTSQK